MMVASFKTSSGAEVQLVLEPTTIKIAHGKEELVSIPAASVTEISCGQDVHRRIGTAIGLAVISLGVGALMALSKSKKNKKTLKNTMSASHGPMGEKGRVRHAMR
jgi:hypothetical protein